MLIFLCVDPWGDFVSHYFSLFEAAASLRLAFVFRFALLVAAAGRCHAHWWGSQFLGFGFLHLHLDGFDVQLAFCGTCDGTEVHVSLSRHDVSAAVAPSTFTFAGLLHQRLLFRRNEVFVSLFLLLAQHLCLLHLIKGKQELFKHQISFILQNSLLHFKDTTQKKKFTTNLDRFHFLPLFYTFPQKELSRGQLLVHLEGRSRSRSNNTNVRIQRGTMTSSITTTVWGKI